MYWPIFIGSFLFSLVGLLPQYGELWRKGRVILFIVTLVVIAPLILIIASAGYSI